MCFWNQECIAIFQIQPTCASNSSPIKTNDLAAKTVNNESETAKSKPPEPNPKQTEKASDPKQISSSEGTQNKVAKSEPPVVQSKPDSNPKSSEKSENKPANSNSNQATKESLPKDALAKNVADNDSKPKANTEQPSIPPKPADTSNASNTSGNKSDTAIKPSLISNVSTNVNIKAANNQPVSEEKKMTSPPMKQGESNPQVSLPANPAPKPVEAGAKSSQNNVSGSTNTKSVSTDPKPATTDNAIAGKTVETIFLSGNFHV